VLASSPTPSAHYCSRVHWSAEMSDPSSVDGTRCMQGTDTLVLLSGGGQESKAGRLLAATSGSHSITTLR
jgi:hypothetical protein